MHVHTYTYVHIHVCMHMFVCVYVSYICVRIRTHRSICMYTHIAYMYIFANQHSGKKTVRFARFHLVPRSGFFPDAHLFSKIPGVHTHSYSHIHAHTHKYTLHPHLAAQNKNFCYFTVILTLPLSPPATTRTEGKNN